MGWRRLDRGVKGVEESTDSIGEAARRRERLVREHEVLERHAHLHEQVEAREKVLGRVLGRLACQAAGSGAADDGREHGREGGEDAHVAAGCWEHGQERPHASCPGSAIISAALSHKHDAQMRSTEPAKGLPYSGGRSCWVPRTHLEARTKHVHLQGHSRDAEVSFVCARVVFDQKGARVCLAAKGRAAEVPQGKDREGGGSERRPSRTLRRWVDAGLPWQQRALTPCPARRVGEKDADEMRLNSRERCRLIEKSAKCRSAG